MTRCASSPGRALTGAQIYYSLTRDHIKPYQLWYLIIVIELLCILGSSLIWKVVGFKHTHLVERMGLLTLIIIGEGIIVMLKAVNAVEKGAAYGAGWRGSTFAVVTASIGIIVGAAGCGRARAR